jgi:hypothetical protein
MATCRHANLSCIAHLAGIVTAQGYVVLDVRRRVRERNPIMKGKRLFSFTVLALATAFGTAFVGASSASAASTIEYQVTYSINCNTTAVPQCVTLGGTWGMVTFYTDGTGHIEITDCSHSAGRSTGGHLHFEGDVAALAGQPGWYIGADGDFFITNETDTFSGNGPQVTVFDAYPPYPQDTGIPAAPGHYTAQTLFGFEPPPGFSLSFQVTLHA